MKAMTKSALARAAGVSKRTFRRWMKEPYIVQRLAPLKLSKKQQKLPPAAVQILVEHYSIDV